MQSVDISISNSNSNNNLSNQDVPAYPNREEQNVIKRSRPVDHNMISKYEELAQLVKKEVEKELRLGQEIDKSRSNEDKQMRPIPGAKIWWCAIAGGPGCGKATLAKRVSEICNDRLGIPSIVVPMDGYLYSRLDLSKNFGLDQRGCTEYFRRRGAPHTINAEKFCEDLARASGKQPRTHVGFPFGGTIQDSNESKRKSLQPSPFVFPGYRRTAPSDPIADQIHFDPSRHRVVFVEGEYLLLGKGGMVPGYVTETQSNRWKPLLDIFDSMWFVSCQNENDETTGEHGCFNYDIEEQRRRRMLYHLEEDEDDEETIKAMFPSFSCGDVDQPLSKEDVATKRIYSNDVLNMLIAETCKEYASLVIRSI
mmetsp:Transcript_7331/g.17924  ORF Transcript_7331/g.17924 Transcript_7331/m.17924 type:complete len:366 (-) Transcript_7331:482-1579(-)|eukprot:CAMPEP_0116089434 /NCGR_PEP_ID=MMETSP0327-20121206/6421_1 /TAXON_ID=44447 /ORGANISM="Pseudo-nitzschia delicatissima, Strain B596" /LENGTH=365 /DNA_ID=CAMNT_0003580621 /DNA_START=313 /DNA_END=1410 /DNA_ORIENTATION=-